MSVCRLTGRRRDPPLRTPLDPIPEDEVARFAPRPLRSTREIQISRAAEAELGWRSRDELLAWVARRPALRPFPGSKSPFLYKASWTEIDLRWALTRAVRLIREAQECYVDLVSMAEKQEQESGITIVRQAHLDRAKYILVDDELMEAEDLHINVASMVAGDELGAEELRRMITAFMDARWKVNHFYDELVDAMVAAAEMF